MPENVKSDASALPPSNNSEQPPEGLSGVIREQYTVNTKDGRKSVNVAYSYDFAKPQFDADLSPQAEANQRAAKAHNLLYDPHKQSYVDAEGSPIRDKFGQPY
jgi:hypothetical protein